MLDASAKNRSDGFVLKVMELVVAVEVVQEIGQ